MDDADLTQARMEAEEALRARGKTLAVLKVHYSHCIECGESMQEVRQAHGFANCVDCAEAAERHLRRR